PTGPRPSHGHPRTAGGRTAPGRRRAAPPAPPPGRRTTGAGTGSDGARPPTASRTPACPGRTRSARRDKRDRKSTRLNSSHVKISYAVFCLKKKKRYVNRDTLIGEYRDVRPTM